MRADTRSCFTSCAAKILFEYLDELTVVYAALKGCRPSLILGMFKQGLQAHIASSP